MALGGFLAGLAESSSKWPGAIQQRMLLQREEQQRLDEVARAKRAKYMERLQWMADQGQYSALEDALETLPPDAMPGLGTAMLGVAENVANLHNQALEKVKLDNALTHAKTKGLEEPRFIQIPNSEYFTTGRKDPQTGKLEVTVGPRTESKEPEFLRILPVSGKILYKDGTSAEIADPAIVRELRDAGAPDNPVEQMGNGLVWFKDGTSRPWTTREQEIHFGFLKREQGLEVDLFKQQQNIRLLNDFQRYEAQSGHRLSEIEVKNEWDRLNRERESVSSVFKLNVQALRSVNETPENAMRNSQEQLRLANVSEEKIAELLAQWEPVYYAYAYKLNMTVAQDDFVQTNRRIQLAAEKIHALLDDPDVQAHIGPLSGRLEGLKKPLTGGRNVPKKVIEFRFQLNNMVDAVRRARTGAAISKTEEHFYNDLLGTDTFTKEYLQNTMSSLISSVDHEVRDLYDKLWLDKYAMPPTSEQRKELHKRISYRSDLSGPDTNTPLPLISVEDAKSIR